MPSPFPGMDPYLETPRYWRGFHNALIAYTEAALNAVLPPSFVAYSEERAYVLPAGCDIIPDIVIHEKRDPYVSASASSSATLEPGQPHGSIEVIPAEEREMYIEIRAARGGQEAVTVIEVLSPANKARSGRGREEYLRKQEAVLQSETHLMEIDLLRGGEHTVAAPREVLSRRGRWDYLVCLNRATKRGAFDYWFIDMRGPLPLVRVPLTPGTDDVLLDLQACLTRTYDEGAFSRKLDYGQNPPIALSAEDAAWVDGLLRGKGLRG